VWDEQDRRLIEHVGCYTYRFCSYLFLYIFQTFSLKNLSTVLHTFIRTISFLSCGADAQRGPRPAHP